MHVTMIERNVFKINGRAKYFNRITQLTQVNATKVAGVTVAGVRFWVEGGKKAGGTARDWFLDVEGWESGTGCKSICCTSLVDALNCINGA